ncbi:MAG: hypothetical protein ABI662_10075 [Dermatophilaceae bacterium]
MSLTSWRKWPEYVVVFTRSVTRGLNHMSVTTPPAKQGWSILAGFQTAPTLVKVLASILYGVGLLTLVQLAMVVADVGLVSPRVRGMAMAADLFAVVVALISFALGRGITRGSFVSWLVTLICTALGIIQSVLWILVTVTDTRTALIFAVALAVLALLLTPAVRRHCPKEGTPAG